MYKKTNTLGTPVSPEIAAFSVVMEAKLQLEGYDIIQSWEGIPLPTLIRQLEAKIQKLKATDLSNPHDIFTKAVVIGSLAMMVAELSARKQEGKSDLKSDKTDLLPNKCMKAV
jgi:hypothetical protein